MIKLGRKKKIAIGLAIVLWLTILFVNVKIGAALLAFYFFALILLVIALLFNKLVLGTRWYRNVYTYTHQFVTNSGYRRDLQRNYEIVNLGSNPALFSFFYEDIKGQNWATGSQGPEMDLEILKYYHSYLKDGGYVLIPIVAFSSCTPYLWHVKTDYLGKSYYARFAKVLECSLQAKECIPNYKKIRRWMKYPLFYQPSNIKYVIRDVDSDERMYVTEQPMSLLELNNDADHWIDSWKKEFDIKDLDAPLDKKMEGFHEECADKFVEIVEFCKERGLHPVLVFPPMTSVLNSRFSEKAKETYIYSFVRRIQKRTPIEFLDYMNHKDFISPSLYFNSFFLNVRGRKLFTRCVLKDLNLI